MEVIYEIYFVDVEISLLRYATQNTFKFKASNNVGYHNSKECETHK